MATTTKKAATVKKAVVKKATPVKKATVKKDKPIDWTKVKPGTWFTATIEKTKVKGRIQIEKNNQFLSGLEIFLCQDKKSGRGTRYSDKIGFEYSWTICEGKTPSNEAVKNLVLLKDANDYVPGKTTQYKINDSYTAIIMKGEIRIGCQTISNKVVRELAAKLID